MMGNMEVYEVSINMMLVLTFQLLRYIQCVPHMLYFLTNSRFYDRGRVLRIF